MCDNVNRSSETSELLFEYFSFNDFFSSNVISTATLGFNIRATFPLAPPSKWPKVSWLEQLGFSLEHRANRKTVKRTQMQSCIPDCLFQRMASELYVCIIEFTRI